MRRILLLLLLLSSKIFSQEAAIFAGGCFWCMEPPFDSIQGVISTQSGYSGGRTPNPSYELVSSGVTGHAEAIKVTFDPKKVSYKKLLEVFWKNIDPTVKNKQFCDTGDQYRSAIFYLNEEQKKEALESLKEVKKKFKDVHTEIEQAKEFYLAEEYHQDYYIKNPVRYKYYRYNCGRDKRLKEIWD